MAPGFPNTGTDCPWIVSLGESTTSLLSWSWGLCLYFWCRLLTFYRILRFRANNGGEHKTVLSRPKQGWDLGNNLVWVRHDDLMQVLSKKRQGQIGYWHLRQRRRFCCNSFFNNIFLLLTFPLPMLWPWLFSLINSGNTLKIQSLPFT